MYFVSKSLNVGGNEFLSEGNNNLRNLGQMRLRGLNQTSRLTRGGQTSMGRGWREEDHNKTDFQDPRRLRYLLNVLKVDLLGTMRNAFYYQKINLTKN